MVAYRSLLCIFLSVAVNAKLFGKTKECIAPGTCEPPSAKFSNVIVGPNPGQQWNWNGGFCGSWSLQQCTLAFGAYISQDLIRKANREGPGPHEMHGDTTEGYEVMPINVAYTAKELKIAYDEWDYYQPSPQAVAFKSWMKGHLVKDHPIVFFPICKGDGHGCYRQYSGDEGACPNGGTCDHVEPIFGIFSNHSFDDLTVYDDDVVLHASDQDYMPYYRRMNTLEDSVDMDGNCAIAQAGFGKNEMYPCIDKDVTYGLAVTGLSTVTNETDSLLMPVSLLIDIDYEPNIRAAESACKVHGTVSVSTTSLPVGTNCILYRYNSTDNFPMSPPFDVNYEYSTKFTVSEKGKDDWVYEDPNFFWSDSAVYYRASCAL